MTGPAPIFIDTRPNSYLAQDQGTSWDYDTSEMEQTYLCMGGTYRPAPWPTSTTR